MNSISIIPIDPNMFLLTVFVGMITFSIPFLWNAYQNILDKKKYITGDKIENILTKEFYQKSIKFFEYFVQYPVGIIVFIGLLIVPILFSFESGIVFLTIVFLYFLLLPQIFQKIEEKSSTSLKDFLLYKKAESPDALKVFQELWQIKDYDIEKEFSIKPVHAFEYFAQKIDQLFKNNQIIIAKEYLSDFLVSINNRSVIFLSVSREVFPKILEWHFKIWEKEYKYLTKKDKLNEWGSYREISRILDFLLQKIEERVFKERESFSFFETFKKHAEKHKKQYIESEDKSKKYYYIESLFSIFYRVFFGAIESSPERYDVWEHYFPKEWKITKINLESKENVITIVSLNEFLHWVQEKIWQAKEDFDRNLDDVSHNLFPEVEPILWARILTFVFSPYGENRAKSVIERPWNFGFVGRIKTYWGHAGDGKKEFDEKMTRIIQSEEEAEKEKTIELVYYLAKRYSIFNQFSKENLKKYIKDLKELKYEKESKEEGKRLRILSIFKGMLEYKQ